VFSAFSRAIGQLPDPAFRSVLIKAFSLTVAVFVILMGSVYFALGGVDLETIGWLSWLPDFILSPLAWIFGAVVFTVPLLLFPAIASIFVALFLDEIIEAVEAKHYPNDPKGHGLSIPQSLAVSIKFSLIVIAVNILALPLYLTGILTLAYYLVNGYLFGREYFEMVSLSHYSPSEVSALRKQFRGKVFLTGIVIAFMFTIPIVNFFTPLIAAATMVHIFKSTQNQAA
jgi:CysZ protein